MKSKTKSQLASCPLFAVLLGGCAVYQIAELSNEVTYLRAHMPSETIGMANWEEETWKEGHSASQLNVDVVEYVHPPETVNNWTELLTWRVDWKTSKDYTYPGGVTFSVVPDPLLTMEAYRMSAQQRCPHPIAFRKLDDDRTGGYPSVIFYIACDKYPTETPSLPTAEADVYRVFKGKHGLHALIRARRAASLDDATLDEWTRYMKRFYLCDESEPGQECSKKHS